MTIFGRTIKDAEVISVVKKFLVSGVMIGDEYEDTIVGTPQGGNISPLLANIMLNELDKELETRGLDFVRYADDKSKVDKPKGIKYLGFGFYFDSFARGYKARPHPKAVARLKAQMKKLTCRSWGVSNAYKVEKLNQLIRGWINYFKIGSMKGLCERLDSNIRYRLRMCIWKHWKTPKNRAKNLIKLGIPAWSAWKTAYLHGYAKPARSWDVHQAISNKRLAEFGLISMLDYYAARRVTC